MPWSGLPVDFLDIIGLMALGLASVVIPISSVIFIARKRSMPRSEALVKLTPIIHSIAVIHSVSVFIGVVLLVIWWRGGAWSQLGLVQVSANWYWQSLLVLFASYLVIFVVIAAVAYFLKFFANTKEDSAEKASKGSLSQIDDFSATGLLGYAVLVPIAEEVVFRGVLYGWLRLDMSLEASVLISSVVFGLAHGVSINGIMTFFLGIGLAILYERSGSILPGIVVHMVNNAIAITLLGLIHRGHIFKGAH
jgi:uncharacterized protein